MINNIFLSKKVRINLWNKYYRIITTILILKSTENKIGVNLTCEYRCEVPKTVLAYLIIVEYEDDIFNMIQ